MKLILILRSEDKQKTDSPCEEIQISGDIENKAKAYIAFHSGNCKAFCSWKFRSVSETFRYVPKVFHSVHEAFCFMQIVQRSHGVVVSFTVCS